MYGSIEQSTARPGVSPRLRAGAIAMASLVLVATAVVLTASSRTSLLQFKFAPGQTLYEYHVPGDYLGGDGGMESDYDDVLAPSEFYGTDQKGDAAFGGHGFGAEERNPTYQGDYHEYEGGAWTEMKARPQMLANINSIYKETGMAKPAPAKPIVHHPHHPKAKANAMTVAEYEAKLGKDSKGHLLPKGIGYKARKVQSLYNQYASADAQKARDAYLAGHARQAQMQSQGAAKGTAEQKSRKMQTLYYKAEEQKARDAYLARHTRQAQLQAQAKAKDQTEVKNFEAKVSKELSKLNQIDAMAETVNFIDGPEGRNQGNQVKVGGMFDHMGKAKKSVKMQNLHYVSGSAGAAQVNDMFDGLSHSEHGANNGMLHARAHPRPTARPPTDPKLTPAKSFFATESKGLKTQKLHYVSAADGAAQVNDMFDGLSHSKHGANNGMLHARAHPRPTARPPTDPKLTPAKSFFATEAKAKTDKLWMFNMGYEHHEMPPLSFGSWN